ncbi:hypothetical protein FHS92_000368 [Sphingobium subterraneum]|uniref:Uncharacterized protein n=1 Tax=Sphingobium subterraneum TaxID=627688 RepID=A0A841J2Y2_9SPHN|nr:hypothetical protein [Sphingobium subterraneum]
MVANLSSSTAVTPAKAGVPLLVVDVVSACGGTKGSGTPDQVRGDEFVREAAE